MTMDAETLKRMEEALRKIADRKCALFSRGSCITEGITPCDRCVASIALGETRAAMEEKTP